MNQFIIRILSCLALPILGFAQGVPYQPDHEINLLIERDQILNGNQQGLYIGHKPISRKLGFEYFGLDEVSPNDTLSPIHKRVLIDNLIYADEAWQKHYQKSPKLKYFFPWPGHFIGIMDDRVNLQINPIFFEKAGYDFGQEEVLFHDLKGVDVNGIIDNKVGFFYNLQVHAWRPPFYVMQKAKGENLPYTGLNKGSVDDVFTTLYGSGRQHYTYLVSQGGISTQITKSIGLEFGHGQQFIGHGMRSIFLSDYANNHLYLRLNTQLWKFKYQNLYKELTTYSSQFFPGDNVNPKKYVAIHHLSIDLNEKINFGIFEGVVYHRDQGFELNYLNPIILYRTVEHNLGSPDNSMLGADFNALLPFRLKFYSQFLLDEFKAKELKARTGWWANKYGLQLGLKAINLFGVENLDAQVEYNLIRPFMYTHRDSSNQANYTHFSQPMAHPMGANLKEGLFRFRYAFKERWTLESSNLYMVYGADSAGSNWGGNIFLPYGSRELDYGNEIGQGLTTTVFMSNWELAYRFDQEIKVFANLWFRNSSNALESTTNRYFGMGIKWNFSERPLLF